MNQSVTVSFVPEQVLTCVIIGLIASMLIRGRRFGFVTRVVVGSLGALLSGFLCTLLHIQMSAATSGGNYAGLGRYIDRLYWRGDYPADFLGNLRALVAGLPPRRSELDLS